MSPPPTDALISELAPGEGVGPAGLFAANALRLSTQIPRVAEIAVPQRAPSAAQGIRFVSRAARPDRVHAGLTPPEVAFLEVLEAWERTVEVPSSEAWPRLVELLRSGQVRPDRLARAAGTEPGAVRVRLRALLARAGQAELAAQVPTADPRTAAAVAATIEVVE